MKTKVERIKAVRDKLNPEKEYFFTGIGSTEVTEDEFSLMKMLASVISVTFRIGVRSGRAPGSDQAFQAGVEYSNHKCSLNNLPLAPLEIYLPWRKFEIDNPNTSKDNSIWEMDHYDKASEICSTIHPIFDRLTDAQRKFHVRNVYQTLGKDLNSPSLFVLYCADEDKHGLPKGGTRTATKLAVDRNIPVLNIRGKTLTFIMDWVLEILESRLLC